MELSEKRREQMSIASKKYHASPKGKAVAVKASRNHFLNNPEKHSARQKLARAIKSGVVAKSDTCQYEGTTINDCNGRIEGHHNNYNKPLEVVWMCRRHHMQLHGKRG